MIVQSVLGVIPHVGPVLAASLTILVMTLTGNDITVIQVLKSNIHAFKYLLKKPLSGVL